MAHKIFIFDTTLRDGEQTPGANFFPANLNVDEKLQIARHLELLNVDVIEAGFPFSSQGDFEAVRAVAREIRGPQIAGLARAFPRTSTPAGRPSRRPPIPGSTPLFPPPTSI